MDHHPKPPTLFALAMLMLPVAWGCRDSFSEPVDRGETPDQGSLDCDPPTGAECCPGERPRGREIRGEAVPVRFARIIKAHEEDTEAAFVLAVGRHEGGRNAPVLELIKLDASGAPVANATQSWRTGGVQNLTGLALTTTERGYGLFYTGSTKHGADGVQIDWGYLFFHDLPMGLEDSGEKRELKAQLGEHLSHVDAVRHGSRYAVAMLQGAEPGTRSLVAADFHQESQGGTMHLRGYRLGAAAHGDTRCQSVGVSSEPRAMAWQAGLGVVWVGEERRVCMGRGGWEADSFERTIVEEAPDSGRLSPQLGLAQVGAGDQMAYLFGTDEIHGRLLEEGNGQTRILGDWSSGPGGVAAVSAAAQGERVLTVWLQGREMRALAIPASPWKEDEVARWAPLTLRRSDQDPGSQVRTDLALSRDGAVAIQYGDDGDAVYAVALSAQGTVLCP